MFSTASKKTMKFLAAAGFVMALGALGSVRAAEGANPYLAYDEYQTIAMLDHIQRDNPIGSGPQGAMGTPNPYLQYTGDDQTIALLDAIERDSAHTGVSVSQSVSTSNPYLAYDEYQTIALLDRLQSDARMNNSVAGRVPSVAPSAVLEPAASQNDFAMTSSAANEVGM